MIKAEVVFSDREMHINGFEIVIDSFAHSPFDIFKNNHWVKSFEIVEDAIRYCLQQPPK